MATASIVLAAGRSRRMNSDVPKVLHHVLGLPLIEHVLRAARAAGVERHVLVVNPDHHDAIEAAFADQPDVVLAVQEEPLGTAHAVLAAKAALADFDGAGLVLLGDAPCVSPDALSLLLARRAERNAALAVLSGDAPDPTGYGRVVRGPDGDLSAIVEQKDGSPEVLALTEINSGAFALQLPRMWGVLERIQPSPATGELYATDAVELARAAQLTTIAVKAGAYQDVLGVNDRSQLAEVTAILRARINAQHMANGVTIVDPATTFIDARATIARDVRIEPFSMIQGACRIDANAVIGPFAHVRGDSSVGSGARIGNFVEVVRSQVGADARALHLAYLGDCELGAQVNVGAGAVFANWDGQRHHKTRVSARASIGSNTVLIGPCELGEGARTGSGAIVNKATLPPGETWVGVPARKLGDAS